MCVRACVRACVRVRHTHGPPVSPMRRAAGQWWFHQPRRWRAGRQGGGGVPVTQGRACWLPGPGHGHGHGPRGSGWSRPEARAQGAHARARGRVPPVNPVCRVRGQWRCGGHEEARSLCTRLPPARARAARRRGGAPRLCRRRAAAERVPARPRRRGRGALCRPGAGARSRRRGRRGRRSAALSVAPRRLFHRGIQGTLGPSQRGPAAVGSQESEGKRRAKDQKENTPHRFFFRNSAAAGGPGQTVRRRGSRAPAAPSDHSNITDSFPPPYDEPLTFKSVVSPQSSSIFRSKTKKVKGC